MATPTVEPAAPLAAPTTPPGSLPAKATTYIVKQGDTLTGIATWFRLHGYGALFARNKYVIGSDPNLIRPGERITIDNGVMSLHAGS